MANHWPNSAALAWCNVRSGLSISHLVRQTPGVFLSRTFPIDTEKPDPITGTLLHHPTADAEGKIVLIQSPSYPYEPMLRTLALQRPKAVIITQKRRGEAGEGMFYVDGRDRSGITFPVAETYITNENNVSRLPDGAVVTIVFDENPWKVAKENKFQVVFGFLLSFWQLIILAIGTYRLYQFYQAEVKVSWLSIGPVCLVLEMISVALRLAFTCVDPFWSQRMLPNSAGNAFFTIHMPFQLASGILLTFYCTFFNDPPYHNTTTVDQQL
jgi:hypothetical protein